MASKVKAKRKPSTRAETPEYVWRKLSDLKMNKNNPRTHSDQQISDIAKSIQTYGWTVPVVIDEKNNVFAGHGRCAAAKTLKMEQVPCILLKNLSEQQKRAYMLIDNKLSLNSDWSEDALRSEARDLIDGGIELIGFDETELDILFLSDYGIEDVEDDLEDAGSGGKKGGKGEGKSRFGLAYNFTQANRDLVLRTIKKAKDDHDIETSEAALVEICKHYLGE